jgi:hypothetical protein
MVDYIRPLMEVRDEDEGEEVCEWLRAVGIKCNYETVPDPNTVLGFGGAPYVDCIQVFIRESDMDRARAVVAEHQSNQRRKG